MARFGVPAIFGLPFLPREPLAAIRAGLLAVGGVTVLILILDCWLFRSQLSAERVAFFTRLPLWPRAFADGYGSVLEELIIRYFLMTLLVGLIATIVQARPLPWYVYVTAIVVASALDSARGPALPADAMQLLYRAARYFVPGCVWGWLYWRHGFVTAAFAHFTVHLVFEPAVFLLLRQGG